MGCPSIIYLDIIKKCNHKADILHPSPHKIVPLGTEWQIWRKIFPLGVKGTLASNFPFRSKGNIFSLVLKAIFLNLDKERLVTQVIFHTLSYTDESCGILQ